MCKWWEVEFLLKASVRPSEQPLFARWTRAYVHFMSCFPRLHVVSDDATRTLNANHFVDVPNVTFHQMVYPACFPPDHNQKVYWRIQLPMMWADRFTTAAHVAIFDVDTPLALPLRCHHLFDATERPVWRSWRWNHPLHWSILNDNYFLRRRMNISTGHDFMTFFPVVIPRKILPIARQFMTNDTRHCVRCEFSCAFLRHPKPCYADIIGKSLAFLRPAWVRWIVCDDAASNPCADFVPPTEHVKHPHQNAYLRGYHYAQSKAIGYADQLFRDTRLLTTSRTHPMPNYMFHHARRNRTLDERRGASYRLTAEDEEGRMCGRGGPVFVA